MQTQINEKTVPSFPLNVFPERVREYACQIARSVHCPVDYAACGVLGAAGVGLGNLKVKIKEGFEHPPIFYVVLLGPSGDGKTPPLSDYILKPFEALEAETGQDIMTNDASTTALLSMLKRDQRLLLFADEISSLLLAIRKSKNDAQFYICTWNGRWAKRYRGKSDKTRIPNPRLSIIGGVQPENIGELTNLYGRKDGLFNRHLFSFPEQIDDATRNREAIVEPELQAYWDKTIRGFFAKGPQTLDLTKEARIKLFRIIEETDRQRNALTRESPIWGILRKTEYHLPRLAIVLHELRRACNETSSEEIDLDSVLGSWALTRYFIAHAKKLIQVLELDEEEKTLRHLEENIRKKGGRVYERVDADDAKAGNKTSYRDLLMLKIHGIKTMDDLRNRMTQLEERGRGKTGGAPLFDVPNHFALTGCELPNFPTTKVETDRRHDAVLLTEPNSPTG